VRHDGSPVTLRGAKARQLLILLAVRANRPVPADQLVEELWESSPPPSAATALRVHVAHLRRALEPARDHDTASGRLPAGPHGYVLTLEPNELDVDRFERLVLAARQANTAGVPAAAVPLLTEALDLWRGEALVDAQHLTATRPERERLDELQAVAFEALAESRLVLGEHALLVDVLAKAIERFPVREELTARHMLALYRCGRVKDALRSYAVLARRLDERGLVPAERLRRLEEDILLERPSLDFRRRERADATVGVHGTATRMVGRRQELRSLTAALEAPPGSLPGVGVISGPDGIGKTALANELTTRARRLGVHCFVGTCHQWTGVPFEPFEQVLGEPVVFLPWEGAQPAAAATRFRLFDDVARRLAARGGDRAIVVVEDLHNADCSTVALLRHLVRHRALAGTFFLCTRRDDVGGERAEAVDDLLASSGAVEERLAPLVEAEVRALVRETAPPESVELLARQAEDLRRVSGGSPFVLRELLRELDEELLEPGAARDLGPRLERLATGGAAGIVGRRVARLSSQGSALVAGAAVVGHGIATDILAALGGVAPEALNARLEECLAARLLIEDAERPDRFSFPHDLVRTVVLGSLPPGRRASLHLEVGRVLAARRHPEEPAGRIAHHLCEGLAPGSGRPGDGEDRALAALYAELAALDAERQFMFQEAARWQDRAGALGRGAGAGAPFPGR